MNQLVPIIVILLELLRSLYARGVISPLVENKTLEFAPWLDNEDDVRISPSQDYRNAHNYINKWLPQGGPQIPYTIDALASATQAKIDAINNAIAQYNTHTCIRFIPRTTETDYIQITVDGGCWSYVGRVTGVQQMSIGSGCESPAGIMMHEFAHALGFMHEHVRPDRGNYVTINEANIDPNTLSNFQIMTEAESNTQGIVYDYTSMMHYPKTAFSTNGQLTIVTIDPSAQDVIGQRSGFSTCDKEKINLFYGCTSYLTNDPTCYDQAETTTTTPEPAPLPTTASWTECKDDKVPVICNALKNLACPAEVKAQAIIDSQPATLQQNRDYPKILAAYQRIQTWCRLSCGICTP